MKVVNVPNIIPVGAVMNATINSVACQLYEAITFSVQVVFTGTPTGSFKLQSSNDKAYSGNPNTNGSGLNVAPINWTDITGSSFAITAAGSLQWNFPYPGFNWVRLVYTDTSGGTATSIVTVSTFNAKGF